MTTKRVISDNEYTVIEAAEMAGLTPSRLRIWEHRYGWPKPRRTPSGFRVFTKADIIQLKQVAELVLSGTCIADLIKDGELHLQPPPQPEDEQRALINALYQQVSLMREVISMGPVRRYSEEGQRLAAIALNRSASVIEMCRRRSKASESSTIDSGPATESVSA